MANPWHPWNQVEASPQGKFRIVGLFINGRGDVISTGYKGHSTPIPYDGMIVGWDLTADKPGSIVIDVWKDTWDNFPPTVADTIAGTEKPTLSSQIKNQDLSLSSWTREVRIGDVMAFSVDSASVVTQITLGIRVRPY